MTWKDVDTDLVALFGEASRARGHVKVAAFQAVSAARSYDFGELFTGHGLRTSRRVKTAEAAEFKKLYLRKWYREAKASLEKLTRIHASRAKAKAAFRERLKIDPKLRASVAAYIRKWCALNKARTTETKRAWTRRNAERLNAKRRATRLERARNGVPSQKRKPLTSAQRDRANERNRAWEERNRASLKARRRERYRANLDEMRRKKRDDARARYAAKKKPPGWSLASKAARAGLPDSTVRMRIRRGWSLADALRVPVRGLVAAQRSAA